MTDNTINTLQDDLNSLAATLSNIQVMLSHYGAALESVIQRRIQIEADISNLEKQIKDVQSAAALLHALSNISRERLCNHLSNIVSTALQYVYGPDFRFEFELSADKKGNTLLDYYVVSGDGIRTRPQDARGGGVIDIISIALRIGILTLMNNPPLPGPVILDEPGRHLDNESAVRFAEFLSYIAKHTGRQFVVITHHDSVASHADTAYRIIQAGDTSVVEKIV